MYFPWGRTVPRSKDPTWRIVFWLIIVLIVVGSLFAVFTFISWALGCGNISECIDRIGLGEIFSRMPWLGALCAVFIILAVIMAVIGMLFWRAILEKDGVFDEKYVRKRFPPQQPPDVTKDSKDVDFDDKKQENGSSDIKRSG